MKAKMEQSQAINPNPVLSVEKDGTILFSNKAGEPLLHEWGVRVGEKLPPHIGDSCSTGQFPGKALKK